ncbi:DUF3108 domain-containing protein [Rhizobiaceae bacterium BDR2-2]|uniref:DUF3108 domain-containing protein n=1 Tax=Ectorhizobium quercum TaxID=2965071 RepID=A0AAE3N273_9HYPH|nr:DUF3108 domain-containing protein [Ectorhizobium quercum]MCX8999199.1 DUF3108 domain-containing protein [Ectorhizobium quercum]
MTSALRLASFLTLFLAIPAISVAQTAGRHVTDYTVRLAGFTIATASFDTVLKDRGYSVAGRFRTAGIAGLLTTISGETTVEGAVARGRLAAGDYRLVYKRGERSRVYDVKMRNGNVTSSTITPAPRRNPDNWVAVRDADLRRVADPLSGLMIPAGSRICPSTLPIYDGETRMDIVLTDKGTKPFTIGKRQVEAIVCGARYVPKAGYRRDRKDVEYLKSVSMEIWFAKSDVVDLYAPVYARIPTKTGTLVIAATRFGN